MRRLLHDHLSFILQLTPVRGYMRGHLLANLASQLLALIADVRLTV